MSVGCARLHDAALTLRLTDVRRTHSYSYCWGYGTGLW